MFELLLAQSSRRVRGACGRRQSKPAGEAGSVGYSAFLRRLRAGLGASGQGASSGGLSRASGLRKPKPIENWPHGCRAVTLANISRIALYYMGLAACMAKARRCTAGTVSSTESSTMHTMLKK